MPHIKAFYAPASEQATAPDLDVPAMLERFRALAGDELMAGWRVVAAVRSSFDEPWLLTLENDADNIVVLVRERLTAASDPAFVLFPESGTNRVGDLEIDALSLPLPNDVPRVLIGSEELQRKRAATQGVLTGLIISAVLGLLTAKGSVVRHMFDPHTPTAAVPTSILCLFFWGLIYGMNRRRRLQAIDSLCGQDLLPAVVAGLQKHGVDRMEEALRGEVGQYSVVRHSPLLRRIWVTLEQWLIRPNLQNAHLVIEQQVISDREATQRAYNLLRIFVWATPVLGLIGTVVGISIAVGGFASFLSTNVDDISKIKEGLVGVTGGLSFAFLITLEGLLTSLILMLFTSNIQTREERLYATIERDVAERFLPELQRISPERDPGGVSIATDAWAEAMSDAARKVIKALEVAGKRILSKWDETHELYVADLSKVRETADATRQVLDTQTAGLSDVLADLNSSLRELKPVLQDLSQPFVLQAVPTPRKIT